MQNYTVSFMAQRLQTFSLRNKSRDHFDNIDWVYKINQALNFVYLMMNSNWSWFYSNVTEDMVFDQTTWERSTSSWNWFCKIFEVVGDGDCILDHRNISNSIDDDKYWTSTYLSSPKTFFVSWDGKIKTKETYNTIRISYARMPIEHNADNMNELLDCPNRLSAAVECFAFRLTRSSHFEQGASLANQYFNIWNIFINMYAKWIGMTVSNSWFTV